MANRDVQMTLKDAVAEVLNFLTGLDLEYDPDQDRFQSITRTLNRALRAVALEHEWSYYSSTEEVGTFAEGVMDYDLNSSLRPRIINDDAVRLVGDDGHVKLWAYILPRDALHKYGHIRRLSCAFTRSTLTFSRVPYIQEVGLHIMVPVMREPKMFEVPEDNQAIPDRVLNQPIDFDYPDLVIAKAAYMYAQTDPVMQPRAQTLEATYKDIMYQLIERDDRHTDTPYMNDFFVPIMNGIHGSSALYQRHGHPHADGRI